MPSPGRRCPGAGDVRPAREHGWPPFKIIVDVGHCFELYADFTWTGKSYSQFPDAQSFRIPLGGLRDPGIRERLRLIWSGPILAVN